MPSPPGWTSRCRRGCPVADLRPPVTDADCKLIGAGDGSVMVYCTPCRSCLCPRVATLNAALGFWEEHQEDAHELRPPGEWTPPPGPNPWIVEGPPPHHTDPRCPELFAVTPGRDACTCPRPRPDEPPF